MRTRDQPRLYLVAIRRWDESFLPEKISASVENVIIARLWYRLRSVPKIQYTKTRAARTAICEEEVILTRTSARTGGETIEAGGEGKKERWKVHLHAV